MKLRIIVAALVISASVIAAPKKPGSNGFNITIQNDSSYEVIINIQGDGCKTRELNQKVSPNEYMVYSVLVTPGCEKYTVQATPIKDGQPQREGNSKAVPMPKHDVHGKATVLIKDHTSKTFGSLIDMELQ